MKSNCLFCNRVIKEKKNTLCFECRVKMVKEVLKPSFELIVDYKNKIYKVVEKK